MAVIGHSFLSIIIGQHWTWNTPASARFPSTCWLKSKAAREGRREGAENKVGPIIRMSYLDKKKRFSNFAEDIFVVEISGPRSCSALDDPLDTDLGEAGAQLLAALSGQTIHLFNLSEDPEERVNLATKEPDMAQVYVSGIKCEGYSIFYRKF